MTQRCHVCQSRELIPFEDFSRFLQVTSDCRPHPHTGCLAGCARCGTVQKVADEAYLRECAGIYEAYELYKLSGGLEQQIFSQNSGAAESRSMRLLKALDRLGRLPEQGRLLDVGCGNGGLLRSFNAVRPGWAMWGCELHDRNRAVVEAIPGVEGFHVGDVAGLDRTFDMISLLHSLEHIVAPLEFLAGLKAKLRPGGLLLIDVPDFLAGPFDLLVADHVTHFTLDGLERLVRAAGFDVLFSSDTAVNKELTLLARSAECPATSLESAPCPVDRVEHALAWLGAVLGAAMDGAARGEFGLFGTAIAAVWLRTELNEAVAFFVDEDRSKTGKSLFGVPVITPDQVERGEVLLPFPPAMARQIAERLAGLGIRFILPPDL